ncbi:heme peroxidase [Podospora aff. communis PSN243]|uniref:Heme peroxidase n=1 Tax=Podospora aff. communis PSN243 TaxID=3040156 RepID=A0AAV9GCT1_9PEZI|nr:heme peroxidase [Podospora aff. communis PSN243]
MSKSVKVGIAKAHPKIATRIADLKRVINKALAPESPYPHAPGNIDEPKVSDLCADIQALGFEDYDTLLDFLNAAVQGTADDNDLLLERLIQLLAKLPDSSKEVVKYRSADGSGNNVNYPTLGKAGSAYARTVPPMTFQPPNQPDPNLIFDSLMARGDTFTPHPQGISSMLFYLATIIIHDIFQTDSKDYNINLTSSYLDLSPLYGRNEEEQLAVRTMKDGLLKPDCFSSKRILGFPPGCGVLLIMFNRYHNYVVSQLARINQNNRFPLPSDPVLLPKRDNDLFQTGRLITCGLYANIILNDYVRTILALNRAPTLWNLDPRSNPDKNAFSKPLPQAVGNQVSAEFNLIYRWHSTISQRDERWTQEEFKRLLKGRDPETASLGEVLRALAEFEAGLSADPGERGFAGLVRGGDGTYEDGELVRIFKESVEGVAGAFGANKVPNVLRSVEVLGILQARYWNVATLNEFRAFMGLTRHQTMEDINPDPVVARRLRDLYDSPDGVELYPGLVAEKAKPPMDPGSGLCVNYTTSRAILSDAVALIRGDRFHTIDYTPKNVTNWGYNESDSDLSVNQGHVFHKLVFRAFPRGGIPQNSIYAHFPLVVSSENHKIHTRLGTLSKYSWTPPLPNPPPPPIHIRSHAAITSILSNPTSFKVPWGEPITHATSSPFSASFCLSGDTLTNTTNRAQLHRALYSPPNWADDIRSFLRSTTSSLLARNSTPFITSNPTKSPTALTHEVDIIRDVFAPATTRFMSAMFNLPLKTAGNPHGVYTEHELYQVLVLLFASVFFDGDITKSFALREKAKEHASQLGGLILASAKAPGLVGFMKKVGDVVHPHYGGDGVEKGVGNGVGNGVGDGKVGETIKGFGEAMVARVVKEVGGDEEEAVLGSVVMLVASGVANQTGVLAQALDYYLGDGKEHLDELRRWAGMEGKEADEKVMRYMLEGSRLRGTVALYRDVAADQTVSDYAPCKWNPDGGVDPIPADPEPEKVGLKAGTRILLDLTTASHDPVAFPEPEKVKLDRPLDSCIHYGFGPHRCLGMEISRVVLTEIFKGIVRLPGLRRADGPRGEMRSFSPAPWSGQAGKLGDQCWTGLKVYMTPDEKSYWPMPTTMRVRYEG